MLLLIAFTSFATIALGVFAIAQRPPSPVRSRALAMGRDSAAALQPDEGAAQSRLLRPLARAIVQILPGRWLERLERMLVAAGEPIDLSVFILLWAVVAVASATAGLLFGSIWLFLLFAAAGLYLPLLWLRRRVDQRRRQITRALPDAIDLLVTCVETGLGLDAALIRVGEATKGPLGDEIGRTLREIAVGRSRSDALLDLATRPGVADLESVIRPIVQAERSGVSIATSLRVQADALRVRRRQRAQETAQKIPPKMTMVIAAFFIPAVMLIAIGPAVFQLLDFFQGDWT